VTVCKGKLAFLLRGGGKLGWEDVLATETRRAPRPAAGPKE
jgi:hypothetical protein